MPKAVVRLESGLRVSAQIRDHIVFADEPANAGGSDTAPTPTELLSAALGACAAITAKLYAQRKGWDLQGIEIAVDFARHKAADYGAYAGDADFVHEFHQDIHFIGDLDEEQKARLLDIAAKCPVHRAIGSPAFMFDRLVDDLIAQEGSAD